MSRIRTIKPEFFKHGELYDLELETGLPVRIAFAGLWTVCDREGRFKWKPRELKLDILPYDNVDFSRVLDALATRGFIVSYASNGKTYGYVPNFNEHQVINNRETASVLPAPEEGIESKGEIDTSATRPARVSHASGTPLIQDQGEGKGREGINIPDSTASGSSEGEFYPSKKGRKLSGEVLEGFEKFWEAFNHKHGKAEAADAWLDLVKLYGKPKFPLQAILDGAAREAAGRQALIDRGQTPKWGQGWLSGRRWEGHEPTTQAPRVISRTEWMRAADFHNSTGRWPNDLAHRLDECPADIRSGVEEQAA